MGLQKEERSWLLPPEGPGEQLPASTGPVSMAGLGPVAALCLPTDQGNEPLRCSLSHLNHRSGVWTVAFASWVFSWLVTAVVVGRVGGD